MFDTVAAVRIRIGCKRLFIGCDELTDGRIANRVTCKLIAHFMGIQDERFQFRIRQYLYADIVIVTQIRFAHPCCAPTCRTV
ncbi:hypothetical protein D9M69_494290 [compost metagenome]